MPHATARPRVAIPLSRAARRARRAIVVALLAAILPTTVAAPTASAEPPFEVGPRTEGWVTAPDGARIYVQTWRPEVRPGGPTVPARVPVILSMTPYAEAGVPGVLDPPYAEWRDRFVPQGYAYALGHAYGTGNSDGCLDLHGDKETSATSVVVETLARETWSSGRVGMIGTSYDAGMGLQVAARGSTAARERLAAVVSSSGTSGFYEFGAHDGVAAVAGPPVFVSSFFPFSNVPGPGSPRMDGTIERHASTCRAEHLAAAGEAERTGNFSPWHAERSARAAAHDVRAATLMFEGLNDIRGIGAMKAVGFFERLPPRTSKLVLGQWSHAQDGRYLTEHVQMINAWFDRYLRGRGSPLTPPRVRVQDSNGGWRAEDNWPQTGGPAGQLALSAGGRLGAAMPAGETEYVEGASAPADGVTFTTGKLPGPLHLVGLPVLDLWLELETDDAHVAVQLNAFDADGAPLVAPDVVAVEETGRSMIVGYRSARHLDPIRNGEFRQMTERPSPVNTPIRVPVRFMIPLDLVVPAGGEVTVTVSATNIMGNLASWPAPSAPSGGVGRVRILHDCATHPSALRFLMPDRGARQLDVAMQESPPQLAPVGELAPGLRDGGGVASRAVCGGGPVPPEAVLAAGG